MSVASKWHVFGPSVSDLDPTDMNSEDASMLDLDTRDRLLLVFESSLQISTSTGFYLWTQGVLQCLIPHEILICSLGSGAGMARSKWYSSCRYFRADHFAAACDQSTGLVPRLMREWLGVGRPHFLVPGSMSEDVEERLLALELRNLIGHGARGWQPGSNAYFCFCRTTLERNRRNEHILDLLMPYVYAVFCRVIGEELPAQSEQRSAALLVTPREVEILQCIREGKTTLAIAESLDLSPFTVKNHVNKIFRKFGVKSRSQAVAQAIDQGILVASPPVQTESKHLSTKSVDNTVSE